MFERKKYAGKIYALPIESIQPSPFQARTNFNEQELAGLAASIRENGLLQPIAVRKKEDGYELVAGERRLRACKMAKMQTIPAILCDYADDKTAAMGLDVFKQLNRQTGVTIIIVTHDTNLSKSIDRVVAIRDGRTSSEMLRKKTEILSFGELEKMSEQQRAEHEKLMQQSGSDHEELVVLDRAGRLQIPKEYLEALGIRGGDKVRVELEDGKISVYNSDYNMHG